MYVSKTISVVKELCNTYVVLQNPMNYQLAITYLPNSHTANHITGTALETVKKFNVEKQNYYQYYRYSHLNNSRVIRQHINI